MKTLFTKRYCLLCCLFAAALLCLCIFATSTTTAASAASSTPSGSWGYGLFSLRKGETVSIDTSVVTFKYNDTPLAFTSGRAQIFTDRVKISHSFTTGYTNYDINWQQGGGSSVFTAISARLFYCKDGGAWKHCDTENEWLTVGTYTYELWNVAYDISPDTSYSSISYNGTSKVYGYTIVVTDQFLTPPVETISKTSVNLVYDASATATYTLNGAEPRDYSSGQKLTAEGKYIITVKGSYANIAGEKTESVTMYVDRTAPEITSTPASKTAVSASWSVGSNETAVTATYTLNGSNKGSYSSGSRLTVEGKYVVTATDEAGNATSVAMYVDKTAPEITSTPASKTAVSASWSVGSNETAVTASYTLTTVAGTSAAQQYSSGQLLTEVGKYVVTATDEAGNATSVTMYVDNAAPIVTVATASKTTIKADWSIAGYESPITATYTFTDSSGTSAVQAYSKNTALYNEGKYVFTVTDEAGNTTTQTAYIDKTAPALTRVFEYGAKPGYISWSVEAYETAITATYTHTTAAGISVAQQYSSGTSFSEDGKYVVTATDGAGNSSSLSFTIDTIAPLLSFPDGTTGSEYMSRTTGTVSWAVKDYESPVTVTYTFASPGANAGAPTAYSSGASFTAEGTYIFRAEDRGNNISEAIVIIDKTAPSLVFTGAGGEFERWTNAAFTAGGDDLLSGVKTLEIYDPDTRKYIVYDYSPRYDNGEYIFRITDRAGNITAKTATVYATDTFGNLENIRNSYKLNAWYNVTLPARIFSTAGKDIAGRYSFATYDKALAFAISAEYEFRVTSVEGGYMYISPTNESIPQKYSDDDILRAAVERYAKSYVAARSNATTGTDNRYDEPESLTRNAPALPDFLLDYKNLPAHYVLGSYIWVLPEIRYISDMPYSVNARYIGEFTEASGYTGEIAGQSLVAAAGSSYKQGWYLITETDCAGNREQYLVYSDAELPSLSVLAVRGDGKETLTLDSGYAENNTLYFVRLELLALRDNADPYITLKLETGDNIWYFTESDELPTLGEGDYRAGRYTLTVYDRSNNIFPCTVYIAGLEPTLNHGSLAADRAECNIFFVNSDRYCVITALDIYKIEHNGSRTKLDNLNGVAVSAATLSYTLTEGGKYGAALIDNFGRTIEFDPIFFLKGLPTGHLFGVADGGRTNKNVAFTFDSGDVCEFYILLPGGDRQPFTSYAVQTGATETTYNITADDTSSHEYLIFLHNAQDLSLFVEYTFEIDTILPDYVITTLDGERIAPDGATNKPFRISWIETGVNVRYYTAKVGSLGAMRYSMNTTLAQGTLYYFTISDDVGNKADFTVLLDNTVDYTIDGKYNEVDGVLYAAAPLTFTVNEAVQLFSLSDENGFTLPNGGAMSAAGHYEATVTDNYRNTVNLVFVIDYTPPILTLSGAENGQTVCNSVAVVAFDYDTLYLVNAVGVPLRKIENGEIFDKPGIYRITASDHAGNSATVTFSIDLTVEYTLSVPDGAVTSGAVRITSDENITVLAKRDGKEIAATVFSEPGAYLLTLKDALGNVAVCSFVIVPAKSRELSAPLPDGTRILSALKDGVGIMLDSITLSESGSYAITLDCAGQTYTLTTVIDNTPPVVQLVKDGKTVKLAAIDKEGCTLSLTLDGSKINCRSGQTFDEAGHYVLKVTDELGNVAVYEWDIPFRLNIWAIIAIIAGAIILIVVLIFIIRARKKPRVN